MNTTGAVLLSSIGCFMVVDQIRQPGGETQTFEPRPRPATWVVAVMVKPGGKVERSFGFLRWVSIVFGSIAYPLFKQCVCARYNLSVQ